MHRRNPRVREAKPRVEASQEHGLSRLDIQAVMDANSKVFRDQSYRLEGDHHAHRACVHRGVRLDGVAKCV